MQLINIGFGNIVSANRIIAIVSPESAPIKRIVQEAKDNANKIVNDALLKARKIEIEKEALNKSIKLYKKKIRNTLIEQLEMIEDIEILSNFFEDFIVDDVRFPLEIEKIKKALGEEIQNATIFIVAQRISTIMHADQIIVLDKGAIVGKGTHAELLETCDIYKEIALSQLKEDELHG